MAITGTLAKLSWGGKLFEAEQWNCSLYVWSETGVSGSPEDYVPALTLWHQDNGARMMSAAKLDYVKLNIIDPVTGKYANPTQSNTHFLPIPVGGAGGNCAGQICTAASLRTVKERGRGHAGRIYAPTAIEHATADGNGQMTVALAQALSDSTAILCNSVNDISTASVVVYSKVGQAVEIVTHIKVGRIVDTQRRRRSSLAEAYTISGGIA